MPNFSENRLAYVCPWIVTVINHITCQQYPCKILKYILIDWLIELVLVGVSGCGQRDRRGGGGSLNLFFSLGGRGFGVLKKNLLNFFRGFVTVRLPLFHTHWRRKRIQQDVSCTWCCCSARMPCVIALGPIQRKRIIQDWATQEEI